MRRTEAQAQAQGQVATGVRPLREDVVGADRLQAPLSSFAPEVVDGFFVTPPVAPAEAQK